MWLSSFHIIYLFILCVIVCVFRWDKVHRCVSWVWEIWQLYNNYMKQLDLTELSLGNHANTRQSLLTHHVALYYVDATSCPTRHTPACSLTTSMDTYIHCITPGFLSVTGLKHMLQCPVESGSSDNIQRSVYTHPHPYTVEPLNKGHYMEQRFCPL